MTWRVFFRYLKFSAMKYYFFDLFWTFVRKLWQNKNRERLFNCNITCFFRSPVFSQKFSDNYDNNDKDNCFTAKFVCKLGIGSQRGARIITPLFQYIWFSFLCIFFLIFATREIFSVKSKFHENLSFWGERNLVKEIF